MRYLILWNVDDVNPYHDFGVWKQYLDESDVLPRVKALTSLGFKPTVLLAR